MFELGEKILRKNSEGYWFETTVNDTYLELTKEFPEDYRKSRKGKRTGVEFGAHDVTTITDSHVTSYLFSVGTKYMGSIRFTNAFGVMTVTGDYGNWVFCREFFPNAIDVGVCESYWLEKLRTYSEQDPYEFDEEETRKEIECWLDGTHEYFDEDRPLTNDESVYLSMCLLALDQGELQYIHVAHFENVGRFKDHDRVPLVKKPKYALQVIFDAWDCMVERLKETK